MAKAMKIAIVDDEQDMRQSISQWLALSGFDTETFRQCRRRTEEPGLRVPGRCGQRYQDARHGRHGLL